LKEVSNDGQVSYIANGITSDSYIFIHGLCDWLVKTHQELTVDTAYGSKQVWDMLMECLSQILQELSNAHHSIIDVACLEPNLYDWGQLKAQKIQQRYLKNDFQDGPILTGILVHQILMHGKDIAAT
jgi:hypothetical protein